MTEKMKVNPWIILAICASAVSLIVIDGTIVNVALPSIIKDLGLSFSQAEWVNTAYALVFSALLITFGQIADTKGRGKMQALGIAVFTLGSLVAAQASTPTLLILARVLQGLGGAAVLPTTLSTVNAIFRGKSRHIAFAVWGSVIAGMAAIGPLAGGYLTTYFSWPWIFYINLPLGIILTILAWLFVPNGQAISSSTENTSENITSKGLDWGGIILSSITLASLVYALIESRKYGWFWAKVDTDFFFPISRCTVLLVVAFICGYGVYCWEKYQLRLQANPLIDIRLFKIPTFSLGNIAAMTIAIGEFGLLFALPLYLQNLRELAAIEAGGILAVMAIGSFIGGGIAAPLARKFTPRLAASIGLLSEAIALFVLSFNLDLTTGFYPISACLFVYGMGLGIASAQLTSIILVDIPTNQSGQGSAIQSTTRQIGTALGTAIVATFMAYSLQSNAQELLASTKIPAQIQTQVSQSLSNSAGNIIPALKSPAGPLSHLPASMRKETLSTAETAFSNASASAVRIASGFILLGALAALGLKRKINS